MAYTAHDPRLLTNAVSTQVASVTGRPVGDAEAPTGTLPYSVLYPLTDSPGEGALDDPHQVANEVFQVTCVGASMDSVQVLQKNVRTALLGWSPTVAGFGTFPIHLLDGSGVTRDDDVQPPVFVSTDRFVARVSS